MAQSKIAAIWARVSRPGQKELSPDGQVERVKAKFESLAYTIPPEYIFKVTWTSTDLKPCPEFQALRSLIWNRKVDAVGFLDRDRLECEGLDRLLFLRDCKENGIELVVCEGPPFIDGPEGQIVELALAVGKQRQVERAQSGAKQGHKDRVHSKGLPPTTKDCFGFTWENDKLIPTIGYQAAQLIWELSLKGWQISHICTELTRRGIPTPRGAPKWNRGTILKILKNPVYAGRIPTFRYERVEPHKRHGETFGKSSVALKPEEEWEWLDGLVEQPIVSWPQFQTIQDRLKQNRRTAKRNIDSFRLLRGMVKCASCSEPYYCITPKPTEPRYRCRTSMGNIEGQKCSAKSIACHKMDADIISPSKTIAPRFLLQASQTVAIDIKRNATAGITCNNMSQSTPTL